MKSCIYLLQNTYIGVGYLSPSGYSQREAVLSPFPAFAHQVPAAPRLAATRPAGNKLQAEQQPAKLDCTGLCQMAILGSLKKTHSQLDSIAKT